MAMADALASGNLPKKARQGRLWGTVWQSRFKRLVSALIQVWTNCNEWVLGIRTEPERSTNHEQNAAGSGKGEIFKKARYDNNVAYGPLGYRNIRKILRLVKPGP